MKFDCAKDTLIQAVNIVSRSVSSKAVQPVLEGILFQVDHDRLELTATNMEISVKTAIPVNCTEAGSVVLQSNLIADVVRKLSGSDVFFEIDDNYQTKIECGLSTFNLRGLPDDEFPGFPPIADDDEFIIDSVELKSMINDTVFAVAQRENIPVLTGMKLEISGDQIRVIALDGYRLAVREGKLIKPASEDLSVIVPGKSMSELARLLPDAEENIVVNLSKSQIFFEIGETRYTSRLLEGEFINFRNIIPKEKNTSVVIDRQELLLGTERTALMARVGKNNLIKMDFEGDKVILTSNAEDVGTARDMVPIQKTGDDIRIAFNSKFVIDVLRALKADKITMDFTNQVGPMTIEGEGYTYLILPVRVMN